MVSMCAARYRWERFLGITLAMHHKMDVNGAQSFDYFNECFYWFLFSCRNVQMILNVTCKSGHVQLSCLRTFKKFVGLQPRNCQFQIQFSLTDWSIPLTNLSTSTSFKIQIQIGREHFYLMVCWRSWQHDTDFRGCEVGLWLPFFEIKSNQHKFWQSKPPRQMKIF